MNTAVLISIKPKWCELIASGKKTVEIRKNKPKIEMPFKCYIYCTKAKNIYELLWTGSSNEKIGIVKNQSNGRVIGEFICDYVSEFVYNNGGFLVKDDIPTTIDTTAQSCLTDTEFRKYAKESNVYGWHISKLQIYDTPKELNTFKKYKRTCYYNDLGFAIPKCDDCKDCQIKRPPLSWCYVEELENANTNK